MRKWGRRYGFGDGLATTPADRGVMRFHGRHELTGDQARSFLEAFHVIASDPRSHQDLG
jgi:hypothetical protein